MLNPHVIVVLNEKAGNNSKEALPEIILNRFASAGIEYSLYKTSGTADKQKLEELRDQLNPTAIIACGGDGTINLVAQVVIGTNIKMAIVPAGSANGLAKELKIPADYSEAVEVLLSGAVRSIDAVLVNGRLMIHLADVGLNARVVKRFEKESIRGIWGYARQLWREIFFIDSYSFNIQTEKEIIRDHAISVTFANCSTFGTGAVINPGGKPDDGKFEICLIRKFPWHHLFSLVLKFFIGSIKTSQYVKIISCSSATVTTKKPLPLQIDGEVAESTREVHLRLIPGAIQLLVPQ